jgi:arginine utilization regulatory protein
VLIFRLFFYIIFLQNFSTHFKVFEWSDKMQPDSNKNLLSLFDFENVIIVDEHGHVVFYDAANLNLLDFVPGEVIGKKITSLYKNLNDNNSTLINVLKTKMPQFSKGQKLETVSGKTVYRDALTLPIAYNGRTIGAIEFSKYTYTKNSIEYITFHSDHKVYRRNNTRYTINDIITQNKTMLEIKEKLRNIARTDSTVLLYGKTGTGKELMAQSIHNLSKRVNSPFISQNCAAIPANLFESILFGSVKGSYTGAEDRQGLLEAAQGGTLFLDEINSLDPSLQLKLLKAIEEKRCRRVGSTSYINLDVRIIAATNEDPYIAMTKGKIREDLFFRLSVVQIDIPPLCDRRDDIELLTRYFIELYNKKMDIKINNISKKVMNIFKSYDWPGNVRELKNIIEGAYNTSTTGTIELSDIPERLKKYTNISEDKDHEIEVINKTYKELMDSFEKSIITKALTLANGNITRASKMLKISRQALMYKMDKYFK